MAYVYMTGNDKFPIYLVQHQTNKFHLSPSHQMEAFTLLLLIKIITLHTCRVISKMFRKIVLYAVTFYGVSQ